MNQRLYDGDHPDVALSLTNVAGCLQSLGRSSEAVPRYEAALEMRRRVLPAGHPHILYSQIGLARALVSLGRFVDAEPLLRDAIAQCERSEASRRIHRRDALEATIELYDAWPKPELAERYRRELHAATSAPAGGR
jgi:tetratricopeptide (TPR) repeat protein